ncbi:MAG: hypothetical protein AAGA77_23240 [Bacteroidota bacterium]
MKRVSIYLLSVSILMLTLYSCVSIKFHDYAETNYELAAQYIKQIKDDTIVVTVNTYKEKEEILKRAISKGSSNAATYRLRLQNLQEERDSETKNLIDAFERHFSFAEVLYMPDSLVNGYERGEEGLFFLDSEGKLDPAVIYNNRSPVKIIQIDAVSWNVVIGNTILPNPFPNNYGYKNGLAMFFGLAPQQKIMQEAAKTFHLRFVKYYNSPDSRLYY